MASTKKATKSAPKKQSKQASAPAGDNTMLMDFFK